MPRNLFKTDCDCDCGYEYWAALKKLLAHIVKCQDACEYAINNPHFGQRSQDVMIGRNSLAVDIRNKIEEILE